MSEKEEAVESVSPSLRIKDLSKVERELLDVLGGHSMKLSELRKMNPRFCGALGKLKQYGLVKIERVRDPTKDKLIIPVEE